MPKKLRAAINGYGRIGRAVLRSLYERHSEGLMIQLVAINGMGSLQMNAHLTEYDTTHGKFPGKVETFKENLLINESDSIHFLSEKDPSKLPWKALEVDIVYECTGQCVDRQLAEKHLAAGAKKVLISAPCKAVDATIVYGVNHSLLDGKNYHIVSAASCTTNALGVMIQPIQEIGIESGMFTTIHAYTSDQRLLDNHHTDFYRARSATQSIIPSKTGAASTIGTIFPELQGKLKGCSVRVPTPNVSLIDFTFTTTLPTNTETINSVLQAFCQKQSNVLYYTEQPLVSSDFNHSPFSAIILGKETLVSGRFVKVLAWYDNEWGFSNRLLDITIHWFFNS